MQSSLEKAKSVLVAIDQYTDFDKFAAMVCMARALRDEGKDVVLFFQSTKYVELLSNIFPTDAFKSFQKESSGNYIVTIPKNGASVKNVWWKEIDDVLNIYITTEQGELNEKEMRVTAEIASFDVVITLGIESLGDLGSFYLENKNIFNKERILQLGKTNVDIGDYKYEQDSEVVSYLVFKFLKDNGIRFDSETATDLMAGILWKTNGVYRFYDSGILESLSSLVNNGANTKRASDKAFKQLKLKDIRLIQQVYKNLNMTPDNIAYSIIQKSQSKGINMVELIVPIWHMLDRIKIADVAFVLIQNAEKVYGIITCNSHKYKANEISSVFQLRGDRYEAFFMTDKDPQEVKELLLKEIEKHSQNQTHSSSDIKVQLEEEKVDDTIMQVGKEERENIEKTNNSRENMSTRTQTAEILEDPLKPATETPTPLRFDNADQEESEEEPHGYSPPPPMSPMDSE